jgi:hypothetical protein
VKIRYLILYCFNLLLPALAEDPPANSYDSLGGWMQLSAEPRRFFYTQSINGVWWLIDPAGQAFISKGVNHISYTADRAPSLGYSPYEQTNQKKYESQSAWGKEAATRLRLWGFNSIGSWSNEVMRQQEIPYTLILNIAESAGGNWEKGDFPDVYSKEFKFEARRIAQTQCWKRKDDINLIGYFTDNELRWGPDWRCKDSLLISYLKMKADAPGNQKAVQFLQDRYKTIAELNAAWNIQSASFEDIGAKMEGSKNLAGEDVRAPEDKKEIIKTEKQKADESDFLEQIARQYFQVCREAIHKYDPNHLILGCRFAGYAPRPVLKGLRDSVDIVSYNSYNPLPPSETLREIYEIAGKPILIGEFSFKALDSGLPNTKGAGKPLQTQQERAEGFTHYAGALMKQPFIIGYHWFEYADEPAEGRFDGENSNYGLVNIKDEPWEILTMEMARTNSQAERMHSESAK